MSAEERPEMVADPPFTLVYWRYHDEYREDHDTLNDAVQQWRWGEEDGTMSADHIEFEGKTLVGKEDERAVSYDYDKLEALAAERLHANQTAAS